MNPSSAENEVAESNGLSHGVRRARVGCTSDHHDASEILRPIKFPRRRGGKCKEILPRWKVLSEVLENHGAVDIMTRLGDHFRRSRLPGLRFLRVPGRVKSWGEKLVNLSLLPI